MNKEICKKIVESREKLVPFLFTARQIDIIKKYLEGAGLGRTEKTMLYSTIKKKIDCLMIFRDGVYVKGEGMINERVEQAKEILKDIGRERAFISGTFLYAEKYNDIDIYIVSERRKQYHEGKRHFVCITESDMRKPLFISASKCSVSTFFVDEKEPLIGRPTTDDLLLAYQLAINEILDNDDQKTVRDLLFEYYIQVNHVILDSYSLNVKAKEIIGKKKEEKIAIVNNMVKEMLLKLYSKRYIYDGLRPFIKRIKGDIKEYSANENLIIYYDLLTGVKDECRRAET